MKIGVVGLGFVGLVTAAVLAMQNNKVTGIDIDSSKVDSLKNERLYFHEPELQNIISKHKSMMLFSTDFDDLVDTEVVFITVPTPNIKGRIDTNFVQTAIESILRSNSDAIVAIKSTVTPGTSSRFKEQYKAKIISNPEFLREGNAVQDTINPDRIVIGGEEENVNVIENVWKFTGAPVIKTTRENAELIKYASNSFLATKISFINEIANLCEKIPNCDIEVIAEGMGLDRRIGPRFLKAGIGFGGSCFPKDTKALISYANQLGINLDLISSTLKINDDRIDRLIGHLKERFTDLSKLRILQLGLSFKENTDDIRESPAQKLYLELIRNGAKVKVFDPVTKVNGIDICPSIEQCLDEVDVIIIATEWPHFKVLENLNIKIPVIDGRRILNPTKIPNYIGIGMYCERS